MGSMGLMGQSHELRRCVSFARRLLDEDLTCCLRYKMARLTQTGYPLRLTKGCYCGTAQSFRVPSSLPERAVRPSGEKATELIRPECRLKVRSKVADAQSQSIGVPSSPAQRAIVPSGEMATDRTESGTSKVRITSPVSMLL